MSTQQGHENSQVHDPNNRDQWAEQMHNTTRETVPPEARHQYGRIEEENRLLREQVARSKRNKVIAGGVVGTLIVGGGIGWGVSEGLSNRDQANPPATAPAVPGVEVTSNTDPNTTMDASELPTNDFAPEEVPTYSPEVQEFVDEFPGRYDDPESAYFAYTELAGQFPDSLTIIPDFYFDDYGYPESQSGNETVHGFERPIYDSSFNLNNIDNYTVMINEHVPNLQLLVNQLSKNPGELSRKVVLNEFQNWTMPSEEEHDQFIDDIVAFIDANGGSSSNFYVHQAIRGPGGVHLEDNSTDSIVVEDKSLQLDSEGDFDYQMVSSNVSFGITVVNYNAEGENTQTFMRLPTSQVHLTKAGGSSAIPDGPTNISIG